VNVYVSGSYKPRRDIPLAVKQLGRLSPTKIVRWIQDHRTETDVRCKRVQVIRTPQSISHWFERNPKVFKQLDAELKAEVFEQETLSETIFENGNFRELTSIKNWERDLAGTTVEGSWVRLIKRVCMGNMRIQGGRLDIEGWGLKHPDRLNLEDAKDFIAQLKRNKISREWRLALRSFLQSKGIVVKSKDISGELEEDAGQYAHLVDNTNVSMSFSLQLLQRKETSPFLFSGGYCGCNHYALKHFYKFYSTRTL
jgi:hypothetical protein